METVNERIQLMESPAIELLIAMYRVVNHEFINESVQSNVHISPEIENWVERTKEEIPDEMLEELHVFFNRESILGLTLIPYMIKNHTHLEVHSFLGMLHYLSLTDLFWCFTHSGYTPDKDIHNYDDPEEVIQYLEQVNLPKEEKWKIHYLIFQGEQTKKRFIQCTERFYYQYFQSYEKEALEHQRALIQQLQTDIEHGRVRQIEEVIAQHAVDLSSTQKLLIIPSYFKDTGLLFMQLESLNLTAYVLGTRHLRMQHTDKGDKETLEAIRILTDERRFKVLQMLKKQPYYGYELAQALNVSNSTISHHITSLIKQQFVRAVRKENRVYYEVNKSEIQYMIDQFKKLFIE